ncbi:WD repeat and HMG-box DNA-binding protein 1 [Histomonas meleagridis]|uniref:WD repeat and HMG-box DNA-binding protein 1 n=1 Tax=Histomonas meleagridis TaxID=135588 RepID=UPI003559A4F7|nr:WD repeat and HMG-box DNA-binding protein 1 [Histomonas meleagridis]KAH0801228.1 WD repeat and HMG-box DNA-binding protein 1 [Histomonas meleagridis]
MQKGGVCLPSFTRKSDLLICENNFIRIFNLHKKQGVLLKYKDFDSLVITCIATSPNSDYIATYTKDNQIIISEFDHSLFVYSENPQTPQILTITETLHYEEEPITSMCWCENSLCCGDSDGTIHLWITSNYIQPKTIKRSNQSEKIIKSPVSIIDALNKQITRPKKDIESEDESLSEISEEEIHKFTPAKPKIISKSKTKTKTKSKTKSHSLKASNFEKYHEKVSDDSENEFSDLIEDADEFEERLHANAPQEPIYEEESESETSSDHEIDITEYLPKKEGEEKNDFQSTSSSSATNSEIDDEDIDLTELYPDTTFPFMPGNCDSYIGNRRYLCWNEYAAVLLRQEDDGSQEIDIHYSDGRIESLTNQNNFTIVTIDEFGLLCASETTIVYRHHKTWAPDQETSLAFNEEKIKLIACGNEWFAIATDFPCIRIFTSAGLEIGIFNLPLQCTVMTGRNEFLFFAYGSELDFIVLNVNTMKIVVQGIMPIRQPLKWVSFSTDNLLVAQDNMNIIYKLSGDFSLEWIPVVDLEETFDTNTDGYWVVYADEQYIYGVPLRGTISPSTNPIPNPHEIEMIPLTFDKKVRNWLLKQMNFGLKKHQQKSKIDAELLKMFSDAIQNGQQLRAFQIAKMSKSKKVRDFIVKYADESGEQIVADQLTGTKRIKKQKKKKFKFISNIQQNLVNSAKQNVEEKKVYVRSVVKKPTSLSVEQAPKPMNIFDTLKEIGEHSATTFGADIGENKKKKVKKIKKPNMEPIVRKQKRGRKKKEEKENFMPLFQ